MNPVFNSSENFPIYDPDYLWGTTVYEKGAASAHAAARDRGRVFL